MTDLAPGVRDDTGLALTVVNGILDGRDGGLDTSGVGDLAGLLVLGDVEVNTDEDTLALEVDVLDGELV